jgi:hypothetical protein
LTFNKLPNGDKENKLIEITLCYLKININFERIFEIEDEIKNINLIY